MSRGRPPIKQLETIVAMIASKNPESVYIEPQVLEKLVQNGFLDANHKVTAMGKQLFYETGRSLVMLVDWENVAIQWREEEGFELTPEKLHEILSAVALKRLLCITYAEKFVFITDKSSPFWEIIDGFDALNYHVDVVRVSPDAADEKMNGVARLLIDNPKIKTVFIVSHDNGFADIMEQLKNKKKKVVRVCVCHPTQATMRHANGGVVRIQSHTPEEAEKFKNRVRNILKLVQKNGDVKEDKTLFNELFVMMSGLAIIATEDSDMARSFDDILKSLTMILKNRPFGFRHYRIILEVFYEQGMIKNVPKKGLQGHDKQTNVWILDTAHPVSIKFLTIYRLFTESRFEQITQEPEIPLIPEMSKTPKQERKE